MQNTETKLEKTGYTLLKDIVTLCVRAQRTPNRLTKMVQIAGNHQFSFVAAR